MVPSLLCHMVLPVTWCGMDKTQPLDRLRALAKLQTMRDHDMRAAHQAGTTQAELARITGLSRMQVHRITSS